MTLDDLRILLAVSRTGSHSAAARALGLVHTTVARRIKVLERDLNVRLIEPAGGRLVLTAAGVEAAATAERMEAEVRNLTRSVSGRDDELAGDIRIASVDVLLNIYAPRLAAFCRDHPNIRLIMSSSTQVVDLSRHEADIAIRFAEPQEEDVYGRVIDRLEFAVFAQATQAPMHDAAGSWLAYGGAACARYTDPWLEAQGHRARYRVSTPIDMAEMIATGMGTGLLPKALGDKDARLVCLLPSTGIVINVWLLVPEALRRVARLQALMERF